MTQAPDSAALPRSGDAGPARAAPAGSGPAPGPRGVARFVVVVLAILTACWLVVGAIVAPLLPGGGRTAAAAWLLFTILPLAVFLLTRWLGIYPGAALRVLVFRPLWYAQFFVLLLAPVGAAAALVGWPLGAAGAVARAAVLLGGAALAAGALAGYAGSRRLAVRRFVATLPRLPAGAEGMVVAQISDLHVGPHTSRRHLARIAAAVAAAHPDLIAVTGDLVDDFPGDAAHYAAAFASLTAPLGVYAIPGNHEAYAGWAALRPRLEALPLVLLVNRAVVVTRRGERLWVAGTGDPAGAQVGDAALLPDVAATLAAVPPGEAVLALAHNPALWPALAARGVDLTLSGHTHWAQLGWRGRRGGPGWSLANLFLELAMGSHVRGGSVLYINPGTNYWGIPFRIGHAAEVTIVTLRAGKKAAWSEEADS